jgi:hypothetical protein
MPWFYFKENVSLVKKCGRTEFLACRCAHNNFRRIISPRGRTGWQEAQGADRLGRAVLLADVVLPVLPELSAF